ncbi:MAG: Zn-dependent oligopeptidase [Acidobacteriia bacterium]|nr:Zn-dependent oligopeptidase [Terriglobia bacterium]
MRSRTQLSPGVLSVLLCMGAAAQPSAPVKEDPLHVWNGTVSADTLQNWVNRRLQLAKQAVDRVVGVKGPRTIDNTVAPFDEATDEIATASTETGLLNAVHRDKGIRDLSQKLAQTVSSAQTDLALNQKVYQALTAVNLSGADAATRHYVEHTLLEYRLAGVDKDDATRAKIHALQDKITELALAFNRNVAESANQVKAEKSELAGLPADYLAKHPASTGGSVTIGTGSPDVTPVLEYATSGDLRQRVFLAYNERAYPANQQVLLDLLATRDQLARLLGYLAWADLATADQMMGSAANVKKLLSDVDAASRASAQREYEMLLAFARKSQPALKAISQADASYWPEQYRRTAFDFDSQSVRPYFPYDRVQQGILDAAAKLFHVRFEAAPKAPVWDESVTAWDVYDGARLAGRFYLDMHPRPGKDQWFSMYPVLFGVAGKHLPEGALICNFPGGTAGDPGLMLYDDVVTFFHEFGHLMHQILGGNQRWSGISGTNVEGDFVEAPSQMLEEFFHDARILQSFARHYQTGAPLPAALIEKMNRASAFGRGKWIQGQLFYSNFALDLHNRQPKGLDLDAVQRADYARFSPYTYLSNHLYASFTHLTGYSSNYYTYLLDKVIALDFFSQFDRANLLEGPTAMRYRTAILAAGGSKPAAELVKDFLGRPQNMDALKAWMNEEFAPGKAGQNR